MGDHGELGRNEAVSRYLGVDLAWGEGTTERSANETGLVCIDDAGVVLEAGWATGIAEVVQWLAAVAEPGDVIGIDAPLVVYNESGMRLCERQVGQRYGQWQVSAYPSNLGLPALGGVALRKDLEEIGFEYQDGTQVHDADAITFFECYPNTTLVGAVELGYATERPRYKRLNTGLPAAERRAHRAAECDELLRRIATLTDATPPMDLATHPVTAELLDTRSPLKDGPYKHREDLIDAALSAWTAAIWATAGRDRCQILGADAAPDEQGRVPVLIAVARPEQRRATSSAAVSTDATSAGTTASVTAAGAPRSLPRTELPAPTVLVSSTSTADPVRSASPAVPAYSPSSHSNKESAVSPASSSSAADGASSVPTVAPAPTMIPGVQPVNPSRVPSPTPSTVDLLNSATWLLEHAAVPDGDDVAFEAARTALAEAVFDLERIQYGIA
jgi:predicted RNase H-like nuclease